MVWTDWYAVLTLVAKAPGSQDIRWTEPTARNSHNESEGSLQKRRHTLVRLRLGIARVCAIPWLYPGCSSWSSQPVETSIFNFNFKMLSVLLLVLYVEDLSKRTENWQGKGRKIQTNMWQIGLGLSEWARPLTQSLPRSNVPSASVWCHRHESPIRTAWFAWRPASMSLTCSPRRFSHHLVTWLCAHGDCVFPLFYLQRVVAPFPQFLSFIALDIMRTNIISTSTRTAQACTPFFTDGFQSASGMTGFSSWSVDFSCVKEKLTTDPTDSSTKYKVLKVVACIHWSGLGVSARWPSQHFRLNEAIPSTYRNYTLNLHLSSFFYIWSVS